MAEVITQCDCGQVAELVAARYESLGATAEQAARWAADAREPAGNELDAEPCPVCGQVGGDDHEPCCSACDACGAEPGEECRPMCIGYAAEVARDV